MYLLTLDSGSIRFMRIFAVVLKIYVKFSLHFKHAPVYYVYTYLTLFPSTVLFMTVTINQYGCGRL